MPEFLRPGSDLAKERGCRCPVIDNARGAGRGGDGDKFGWFITEGCPIHAATSTHGTEQKSRTAAPEES